MSVIDIAGKWDGAKQKMRRWRNGRGQRDVAETGNIDYKKTREYQRGNRGEEKNRESSKFAGLLSVTMETHEFLFTTT
jgi:hypothetical protein